MGKGRSVILKSLESFFSKNHQNQKSLTKKILILDEINAFKYFSQNLEVLYGKELGEYLGKYLTFWQTVNNPQGSYFLSSDYQNDKDFGEIENLNYFASPFNNEENPNLNCLPSYRSKVAKITLLNEDIYFEKITDYFYFLQTILSKSGLIFDVKSRFKDDINFYHFPSLPQLKELPKIWLGNQSHEDIGFFLIDFTNLYYKTRILVNNNNYNSLILPEIRPIAPKRILEDFLHFLKTTEVEFNFPKEIIPDLFKTILAIKLKILRHSFDFSETDNFLNYKRDKQMIKYLNQMLKICQKNIFPHKLVFCLDYFLIKEGNNFIRKIVKKTFLVKTRILRRNKILVFPFIFLLLIFFWARFTYTKLLFLFIASFSILSTIKNLEKRSFPTLKGFLFDFYQNFLSRITFSGVVIYLNFIRLFYCGYTLFNVDYIRLFSALDNLKNVKPLDILAWMIQSKSQLKHLSQQTLALAVAVQNNVSPIIIESALAIKKTDEQGAQTLKKIGMLINIPKRPVLLKNFFDLPKKIRYHSNFHISDDMAKLFPWRNFDQENSVGFRGEMHSDSGKEVYSNESFISECLWNFIISLGGSKLPPSPKILIYPQDEYLQGDFIYKNVLVDLKQKDVDKLLEFLQIPGGNKVRNEKNLVIYKVLKALQIEKELKFLYMADITHDNLSTTEKLDFFRKMRTVFVNKAMLKDTNFFIDFIERIDVKNPIRTKLIEFIEQDSKIIGLVEKINDFIKTAEQQNPNPKNVTLTASNLEIILQQNNFNIRDELQKTELYSYCKTQELEFFPNQTTKVISAIEDRTKKVIVTPEIEIKEVVKEFRTKEAIFHNALTEYSNKNQKRIAVNPNMPETTTTTQQPWGKQQAKLAKTPNKTNEALNKLYPELKNKPKK